MKAIIEIKTKKGLKHFTSFVMNTEYMKVYLFEWNHEINADPVQLNKLFSFCCVNLLIELLSYKWSGD